MAMTALSEPGLPRLKTVKEVAALLRVTEPTVYTLIKSGALPAITFTAAEIKKPRVSKKTGEPLPARSNVVRVLPDDLREFMNRHRSAGR